DHAGQQVAARGLEHACFRRCRDRARHPLDALAAHQHVGVDDAAVVDDPGIADQQVCQSPANLSVADTSSWTLPGSKAAWPASGTILRSASGQARDSSNADTAGQTTS